jgi:hypothetical protein
VKHLKPVARQFAQSTLTRWLADFIGGSMNEDEEGRIIKFRAFCTATGEMLDMQNLPSAAHFYVDSFGNLALDLFVDFEDEGGPAEYVTCELDQWTGLLDMYGTRIYENDFLFDEMEGNVFLVRWIDWMGGWGTETDGDEGAIYDIVGHCKVAGNKWEGKANG